MRTFLHSEIHNARVTQANREDVGCVSIDEDLLEKADIREFERVLLVDNANGTRLESYAVRAPRNSGMIGVNGAAAHQVSVGDEIVLMTFHTSDRPNEPRCVLVNEDNQFERYLRERPETVPSF